MMFAMLFLGLLPFAFMYDFGGGTSDEEADTVDATPDAPEETASTGNLLDALSATQSGVLQPVDEDDIPVEGEAVDPDTVLSPVDEDEVPVEGEAVDPDTVLQPVDDDLASGSSTLITDLLQSETDFTAGIERMADTGFETATQSLTDGADTWLAPDDGAGAVDAVSNWYGTPVLAGDDPVDAIAAGAGDDTVTLGADGGYVFGEEGDDTLTAGDGAAALFGGTGDDTLTAGTLGSFLDGGDGEDVLLGGAGSDALFGGAHDAGDDAVQDDDYIDGGAGDDLILGGYGSDVLIGGDGDDVINHLGTAEEQAHVDDDQFDWRIDGDADTLDGGAGNDMLIMDRADTATGGEGDDVFWVWADDGAGMAATITDFELGSDFLRITLDPAFGPGDPSVVVEPSEDGLDGLVWVNDTLMAVLQGTPGATAADVYVELGVNL